MIRLLKHILSVILPIVLISCATDYKRWPEGGPDDKLNPDVKETSIPDGSLNAGKDPEIEIGFSEYIDRNSARSAVNISPQSALKKSKILWYDKSVKIKFNDLDDDQTVVISINPTLKDSQGNPLSGAFSTSFSTGGSLDRKTITGMINGAIDKDQIVSLNYSTVKIHLYKITDDSLNYAKAEPEYSAGLSSDNTFEMKNLSSGEYKFLAFSDINKNSKPDLETEMISFVPGSCDLTKADSISVELTMGYNDTDPPFIKNISGSENNVIKIEFSEGIKFNPWMVEDFRINDEPGEFEIFHDTEDQKSVWIRTKELVPNDIVTINSGEVSDYFGNIISEKFRTKKYTVSDSISAKDFKISSKLPSSINSDGRLMLKTNDFMSDDVSISFLSLKDSTESYIDLIKQPYKISAEIKTSGAAEGEHELMIRLSDSLIAKQKILVTEELGYGSISGSIDGSSSSGFLILLKPVKGGEKNSVQAVSGQYKIDVRPGKYLCAAFENKENKLVYWNDIYKEKTASVVFYPDTVLVRRNWETSEIDFKFKNSNSGR
ncbi:MAG TPA: Ig-like domain-containing protein [Clostridiales bacterium]|nr:Ig-like domain-containing protein [Clostridiales bacterium]